jgi:hypothetical protein
MLGFEMSVNCQHSIMFPFRAVAASDLLPNLLVCPLIYACVSCVSYAFSFLSSSFSKKFSMKFIRFISVKTKV